MLVGADRGKGHGADFADGFKRGFKDVVDAAPKEVLSPDQTNVRGFRLARCIARHRLRRSAV